MRVLALDPGLSLGFALYAPTEGLQCCGSISLHHCTTPGEILSEFADEVTTLIQARRPTLLAVERPFGRAHFTAEYPGHMRAVAHMLAYQHGLPIRDYTASAVKKGVAGSGTAKKPEVIAAVRARFGFDPQDDHAADAAAVAVLAWAREQQA